MRFYAVQKSSSMINLTLSDQLLRNQSLRDQSDRFHSWFDRIAIDSKDFTHYVINLTDFTEGLIALRLIRRIDHAVIDPKDFTEG